MVDQLNAQVLKAIAEKQPERARECRGVVPAQPKEPTSLEIAADAANREADCAFSDRKEALRAVARRLGIAIDESTRS